MFSTESILSTVFNKNNDSNNYNNSSNSSSSSNGLINRMTDVLAVPTNDDAVTTTSTEGITTRPTKKKKKKKKKNVSETTSQQSKKKKNTTVVVGNEEDYNSPDNAAVVAPILIGAGQGTTGTHFFAQVTCHLGYTSLHYHAGCIPSHNKSKTITIMQPPPPPSENQKMGRYNNNDPTKNTRSLSSFTSSSSSSDTPIPPPKQFQNLQYNQRCLIKQFRALWSSQLPPAVYRNQTLDYLENIIVFGKENGIFLALHDTPYPFLVPSFVKLVRKHYNGRRPIVLLSERDPFSYAKRRFEMHGHDHIMCKDLAANKKDGHGHVSRIDPVTLEGGAFDLIGCIDRALDGISEKEANRLVVGDLFESFNEAYVVKGPDYVAREVEMYQNAVRGLADFAFDVFAQEEKTKVEDLATLMHSKLGVLNVVKREEFPVCSTFVGEDCVMDHVNFSKNFTAVLVGTNDNDNNSAKQCNKKSRGGRNQTKVKWSVGEDINPCAQICDIAF